MFFSIYTLGCKLNQIESEAIADAFTRAGFTALPWGEALPPESDASESLLVVNTCTVTSKAEQKARRVIRNALRAYPHATLIITGCYAQLDAPALAELADGTTGRLFVLGGEKKSALLDLADFLTGQSEAELPGSISRWMRDRVSDTFVDKVSDTFRFNPSTFSFHSRASLKIQDGCDHRCSYCRVCLARGKSVSLQPEQALASLRTLEEKGFTEAVITGVNIGQYQSGGLDLGALLSYLIVGTGVIRLRLSSLEPDGITESLIAALTSPRIWPHFHLSVQSGSPAILARMRRPYKADAIEQSIALLRAIKHDPFLACDMICGFPGENNAAFAETFSLCERVGFAWIHAFPYSPRPGTEAYTANYAVKERVSERETSERVEQLLALAREGRRVYVNRWLGHTVEAVVESGDDLRFAPAMSENYLRLRVPRDDGVSLIPGSLIHCLINGFPQTEDESRFDAVGIASIV
jgi:threonylcarbamoyladenosine tRNA methylthiotransferase MtaB